MVPCGYIVVMQTVDNNALEDNLGAYERAAEAEEVLAQLVHEVIVTSAKRRIIAPPECLPLASFEDLMQGLAADRADP